MITKLPEPDDLTSLLVRADYSDDAAWHATVAAATAPVRDPFTGDDFEASFTLVDDQSLDGVGVDGLITLTGGELPAHHLFVADAVTMRDPERTLLVVDLEFEAFADPADAAGGVLRELGD